MNTPRPRSNTTPSPEAPGDPARTPPRQAAPHDTHADAAEQSRLVDEESKQSFPASDPPSWTLGSR